MARDPTYESIAIAFKAFVATLGIAIIAGLAVLVFLPITFAAIVLLVLFALLISQWINLLRMSRRINVPLSDACSMFWDDLWHSPQWDDSCLRRPERISDVCSQDRHENCSLLDCDCICHAPDPAVLQREIEAASIKRMQRWQEMRATYPVRATTRAQWRAWLSANHTTSPAACLLFIAGRELSFQDAVEEAICFGWIDEEIDPADRSQFFTPRERGSDWSPYHRSRFAELVKAGLVTEAGMAVGPDTEARPAERT